MGTKLSRAYLLTKVLTASNCEVVLYLYEGAIGYLHRATEAIRQGQPGEAGQKIERAISIVVEMSGNLNYAGNGQLALRLEGIYNYLIESLSLANSRKDIQAIEACEGILVILHDAWQQAANAPDIKMEQAKPQLRISA